MNKKSFLLFLLLTPLIVIVSSTLAFRFGFGPEATKNNAYFSMSLQTLQEWKYLQQKALSWTLKMVSG